MCYFKREKERKGYSKLQTYTGARNMSIDITFPAYIIKRRRSMKLEKKKVHMMEYKQAYIVNKTDQ